MKRRLPALLLAVCALAGVVLVTTPAGAAVLEQASSLKRSFYPFHIEANHSDATFQVDQTGSGSVANFKDGGTSETTIDQSGTTSINPLTLSGTGNVNGPQLDIQSAPTQATPPFVVRNSSGTPVASISSAGAASFGSLSAVSSAAVITTSNGALWTVPSNQTWVVHRVLCNITTNFDCTGDDCALIIGDGNDTDGFLVLADAELQTADTEGTGFAAGWQGMVAATVGAYLDPIGAFVYKATDTIDIDIRDASAGTNPTAGAGTCYLDYERWN